MSIESAPIPTVRSSAAPPAASKAVAIGGEDRGSVALGVRYHLIKSASAVLRLYHDRQVITSVVLLSVAGLLIHSAWLTSRPLSAGDWNWISSPEANSWFPWRSIWDSSTGFGEKLFANSNLAPLLSVAGLLSRMGLGWGIIEKLLFFWPFGTLSFVAPWVFARTILRSSGWAFVAVPIFALNTSLIVDGSGHLSLGMAEVLALLVLAAFLVALTRLSVVWSMVSGLLLGLEAIYEIRIAYLTVLVAVLYLALLAFTEPRMGVRRLGLSLLALIAFLGTQAFWVLPLLTYRYNADLPVATSPWIPFSRLANGLTGVHPWWTGGPLSIFQTAPLSPAMFLLPIVAFIPLLIRKVRPEVVWLSLIALFGAFLVKQDNPPVGQFYDWFFSHFPGWGLFRDASKLYFIIALSYAVLVPIGIRWALQLKRGPAKSYRLLRILLRSVLAAVLVIATLPGMPLVKGQIGYSTQPTSLPSAFAELQRQLESDKNYGPVLWLGGGSVLQADDSDHHFRIASPTHPLLELTGSDAAADPLTSFCPTPKVPYCYVEDQLLPYLLSRTGAAYLVSPESSNLGALPPGISWQWLDSRLRTILGPPLVYGNQEPIAVWALPRGRSPIEFAPAVALVNGPPQVTKDVLPALNALDLPVLYSQRGLPPSLVGLPAIAVIPALDHSCRLESQGEFVVLASTTRPNIDVLRGQTRLRIPNIFGPQKLVGWGVYGPVTVAPGEQLGFTGDVNVPACLAWSPLTNAVLRGEASVVESSYVNLQADLVAAGGGNNQHWVELKRAYDPGWSLSSNSTHVVGDGLFNLYSSSNGRSEATFKFSTAPWEQGGAYLSIAWTLLIGLGLLILARRRTKNGTIRPSPSRLSVSLLDLSGRYAAVIGMSFLGLACVFDFLAWRGLLSQMPVAFSWIVSATGDPYAAYEYYVTLGFFALLLAVAFRTVGLIAGNWQRKV